MVDLSPNADRQAAEDRKRERMWVLCFVSLAFAVFLCLSAVLVYRAYDTRNQARCPGVASLYPGQTVTITCPAR